MDNVYQDIHRSIFAYLNNFLSRYSFTTFETFDFDTHTVENDWPSKDLIGIQDYSVENSDGLYMVTFMVAVCTMADDDQLVRLRNVVGKLCNELKPAASGELFKIVDSSNITRGYMTIGENVMFGPAGKTETRPVIGIAVEAACSYLVLP